MDKKTLMAIALAILVMASYSYIMQKYYPAPKPVQQQPNQTVSTVSSAVSTVSSAISTVSSQSQTVSSLEKFPSGETIKLSSANVDYDLSDIGGCVKSINIKKYNGLEKNELIYNAEFDKGAVFSIPKICGEDMSKIKHRYFKLRDGAEFSVLLKNGIEVKKIYKLNKDNGLDLELNLKNTTSAPINVDYFIVAVSYMKAKDSQDQRFIESSISLNGKRTKVSAPRDINSTGNVYPGKVDWATIQGKYFSLAVKPYQQTVSSTVSRMTNSIICIELQNDTVSIGSNDTVSNRFLLYAGPADYNLMAGYQAVPHTGAGIENSVNLGTFGEISKILLWLLNIFYKVTRNYGVAIILLAILISTVLYPLTLKSLKSMREMQVLQPKIEKIRKEHKDNPQKINKEIMELYKKHKVNPFGGCLPMLLQMPIFIALYQAFSRAIELSGAKFLWIKDLAQSDRAFLIPTGSGAGFPVNILPILMAITMFFQQKMTTSASHTASDKEDTMQQQQKMMAVMMPVLFGFIFYNMPSGLVLYWFVNTLIMFVQQVRVMKSFHVESVPTE